MAIFIKFYTKPKCSLCDGVRILLNQLGREYPLNIEEVNILDDPGLYERYKYEIPVLLFPDGSDLQGKIGGKDLEKKLNKFLRCPLP